MIDRIKNEPALIAGALTAVLNALVLLDVLSLSVEQITGINIAVAAILALFVRHEVTPTRTLDPAPVAPSYDERGAVDVVTILLVVVIVLVVLVLAGIQIR